MSKKINVLHAFNNFMPNSQNWAYNLINSLSDVNVFIYADNFEKFNFYNRNWVYLDLKENAAIHLLKGYSLNKSVFTKKIYQYLRKLLNKNKHKSLKDFILKNEIEIVHSHFGHYSYIFNQIIKDLDVKHVISFYGYDYEKIPHTKPEYLIKYKELFLSADKFICEGTHGANILRKYGCPEDKIEVVHLGLDTAEFNKPDKIKEKDILNLLQIATITEKKGHLYTIRAFLEALEDCPNMLLTLVGSPRSSDEETILNDIVDFIEKNNLKDRITMINQIDYNNLHNYLDNFDVFIHPSCYSKDMDCEGGAPVVLLDAQIRGLPVLSTRHCDIPDEVIDGKTGLLYDEKDILGISEGIKKFYEMDPRLYYEFSCNAFEHVRLNYDVKESGEKLKKIYGNLIDK